MNQKRKPFQMAINQKVIELIEDPAVIEYIAFKIFRRKPWFIPLRLWMFFLGIVTSPAMREPANNENA